MDRNFARAMPKLLAHEGGFVNHPKDPGGATNKGVTLASFRSFVKPNATVNDLKKISDEQIYAVYYKQYWARVMGADLPSGLDYAVFDFAVNSGPDRAIRTLQKVLGVNVDGKVGPQTIEAAEKADTTETIKRLCAERLAFMKRIKGKDGKLLWDTFGKGWYRRVQEVQAVSYSWVGKPADVKEVKVVREVEKPVVPVSVDKQVKEKTNRFGFLAGGVGVASTGFTWLDGADWQKIVAVAGVGVLGVVLFLILQNQLIAAIKKVREQLA